MVTTPVMYIEGVAAIEQLDALGAAGEHPASHVEATRELIAREGGDAREFAHDLEHACGRDQ